MNKKTKLSLKLLSAFALVSLVSIPLLTMTSCYDMTIATNSTTSNNPNSLENDETLFDKETKSVRIHLTGSDLSNDKTLYYILNTQNHKNINMNNVQILFENSSSVFFEFIDIDYVDVLTFPTYEINFSPSEGKYFSINSRPSLS